MGCYRINGRRYVVHHDVEQEARLSGGWAPEHPRAAHFAGGIVKSRAAVPASANVPAENAFIELGCARNIGSGHLDVPDFAVRNFGRHRYSFQARAAILPAIKPKAIPPVRANYNFLRKYGVYVEYKIIRR